MSVGNDVVVITTRWEGVHSRAYVEFKSQTPTFESPTAFTLFGGAGFTLTTLLQVESTATQAVLNSLHTQLAIHSEYCRDTPPTHTYTQEHGHVTK